MEKKPEYKSYLDYTKIICRFYKDRYIKKNILLYKYNANRNKSYKFIYNMYCRLFITMRKWYGSCKGIPHNESSTNDILPTIFWLALKEMKLKLEANDQVGRPFFDYIIPS